jgi:hypothetical protein
MYVGGMSVNDITVATTTYPSRLGPAETTAHRRPDRDECNSSSVPIIFSKSSTLYFTAAET